MSADIPDDLDQQIGSLEGLNLDDLRLRWQATFGRGAPIHLSRHLLLRLCAYRLQAGAHGDLSSSTVQLLDRFGRGTPTGCKPAPSHADVNGWGRLRPGTVLVREHAEANHHVTVVADGYCWNGKIYSSLSQVASAITGTKWNGPRFFGLSRGRAPS
jgi:hypothetical protein